MEYYIALGMIGSGSVLSSISKYFYTSNLGLLNRAEKECIDLSSGQIGSTPNGKFVFASGTAENLTPLRDEELGISLPSNAPLVERKIFARCHLENTQKWVGSKDKEAKKVRFLLGDYIFLSDGFKVGDILFDKFYLDKKAPLFLSSKIKMDVEKIKDAPGHFPGGITRIEENNRLISEAQSPNIRNRLKTIENGSIIYKMHGAVQPNDIKIEYSGRQLDKVTAMGKLENGRLEPYFFEGRRFDLFRFTGSTKSEVFSGMRDSEYYLHLGRMVLGSALMIGGVSFGGCSYFKKNNE